jgi:hypothetical protein
VSRPALEVADIFRDHGAAWRSAHAGHVSLDQLKVMSAIERCRTAALGGHVARCEDCSHTLIAYNSCRNRHCPKCQGAAAKEWLAEREAELLPVPYFHVVFTLPAALRDIAYQNKAVVYDLLFKASAETLLTIAADPKHLGARIGFISVLHTWGSALVHHPHVHMIVPGGGFSPDRSKWVACRPRYFLTVEVLSALFRRLFLEMLLAVHAAGRLQFFGDHADLASKTAFERRLKPLRNSKWVVYCKRPFAGPRQVLRYLSRYGGHLQSPPHIRRRERRHLQVQGLSPRRHGPLQDHDAGHRRVHPPLPHPRPPQGLPPHPSLRAACQSKPRRQHRPCSRVAQRAIHSERARTICRQAHRRTARAAATMSLLRWPHDHHRDLRARL